LVREIVRARGRPPQPGEELLANTLDVGGVEPRRRQREAQQFHRLVLVLGQGPQRPRDIIAGRPKADLDCLGLDALVESRRIDIAGALIEQRRHHGGDAWLVHRILVGAATKGKIDGNQRHRRLAHEPRGDTAGTDDPLDRGRLPGKRCRSQQARKDECARQSARQGKACDHGLCSCEEGSSLTK
jgi:hypothetical protein